MRPPERVVPAVWAALYVAVLWSLLWMAVALAATCGPEGELLAAAPAPDRLTAVSAVIDPTIAG